MQPGANPPPPAGIPVSLPAIHASLTVLVVAWGPGNRVELLCELLPREGENDQRRRRVWLTADAVAVIDDSGEPHAATWVSHRWRTGRRALGDHRGPIQ